MNPTEHVQAVARAVAAEWSLDDPQEILQPRKKSARINEARHAVMYLAYITSDLITMREIGQVMNVDPSTVSWGVWKMKSGRKAREQLRMRLDQAEAKLLNIPLPKENSA